MALFIRNPETEILARVVAGLTGETITQAVTVALRERLIRLQRDQLSKSRIQEFKKIADHCASLPVLNDSSADDILGYDEDGLPNDGD